MASASKEQSGLEALLGSTLVSKDGAVPTSGLAGKTAVGLYFSAHWCGPCRMFTPQLSKIYADLKEKKSLEIVFVSSDHDQKSFDEYHGTMPWLALPFNDRQRKDQLSRKYKVQGIPTLVIVDGNGNTITTDGRSAVMEDLRGDDFPWKPLSVKELLQEADGGKLVDHDGTTSQVSDLNGKVLGLYFSAHWCPPCKMFTPKLSEVYKKLQGQGKAFEVVFISSDKNEDQFKQYHGSMPWKAVPYKARKTAQKLSQRFGVDGIPTLVLIDFDSGATITTDGVQEVLLDEQANGFPWRPKPLNPVETGAVKLNESPGVIAFVDDEKQAKAALEPLANETGVDGDIVFLWSTKDAENPMVDQVRKFLGKDVVLGILHAQAGLVFKSDIKSAAELTDAVVRKFVADFSAGKLEGTALG